MARTQRPHRRVAVSAAARSLAADSGLGYLAGHGAQARVRSRYPSPESAARDRDTWQGTVPKRAFDPYLFARWRCWKEYGTGVAGDLLVHLISGMMFMLGINEPPKQASAVGGIRRWKDGRNMPDVHAVVYYFGDLPVYMRLNLGTEMPEAYRIQGSKGVLDVTGSTLSLAPQTGKDNYPSYYTGSYPHAMREAYLQKWHEENDPKLGERSEEHTSELQSRLHLVCRLLLEKKKLVNTSLVGPDLPPSLKLRHRPRVR